MRGHVGSGLLKLRRTPMRTSFARQDSALRILVVATLVTVVCASSVSARVAARYGGRGKFVSISGSDASGCVPGVDKRIEGRPKWHRGNVPQLLCVRRLYEH